MAGGTSRLLEETQIKLDLLRALTRSQHALASMLENVAELSEDPGLSRDIRDNLEHLVKYQRILAEKMTGVRIRTFYGIGIPGRPWLHPAAGRAASVITSGAAQNPRRDLLRRQ
jgi:hypothetical protein